MEGNDRRTAGFSGQFDAGHGKQYNIGHLSGHQINVGTGHDSRISKLHCVDRASFNSRDREHQSFCLDGTRVDLLHEIAEWADAETSKHVFWLSGQAGTGKSTIARTVSRQFYQNSQLAGSFFFSKGGGDAGCADYVVTTIVRQLATLGGMIEQTIEEVLAKKPLITSQSLSEQWKCLFLEPMSKSETRPDGKPLLLVIDALDECQGKEDISLIIRLLSEIPPKHRRRLRVFITSRPEYPIRPRFSCIEHRELKLHVIHRDIVDHDITLFFSAAFEDIVSLGAIREQFVDKTTITQLVANASGLFIWAATACRYVRDGRHESIAIKRLQQVLRRDSTGSSPERKLDQIYTDILVGSVPTEWDEEERTSYWSDLREILGSILLLQAPLSAASLGNLLGRQDIRTMLGDLQSIIEVGDDEDYLVHIHHPSFRDFLLDGSRCLDTNLLIQAEQRHREIAAKCLDIMSRMLKRDICDVKMPGILRKEVEPSLVRQYIPAELQYACCYWSEHLKHGNEKLSADSRVYSFLREHFLHWMEALSWTGNFRSSITMIRCLQSLPVDGPPEMNDLLRDAYQFVSSASSAVSIAPLQVYCSALLFAPDGNLFNHIFKNKLPSWISIQPRAAPQPGSVQPILQHTSRVQCIAFSPDGEYIAAAGPEWKGTIRIWKVATGGLYRTFNSRPDKHAWEKRLRFSKDSRILEFMWYVYWDDIHVESFDIHAGVPVEEPPLLEGDLVKHDWSSLPANGLFEDWISRIWEGNTWVISIKNGKTLQRLAPHGSKTLSVAFSPEFRYIASGCDNSRVRIWDIAEFGGQRKEMPSQRISIKCVSLSPDGRYVASCDGKTGLLWEVGTDEFLYEVECHDSCVAFSPDGLYVTFGRDGYDIQPLLSHARSRKWTVTDTKSRFSSAGFSSDNENVFYAAACGNITILQVPTGVVKCIIGGHGRGYTHIAISSNYVAAASSDTNIRLWDLSTGSLTHTIPRPHMWYSRLMFTPDERKIIACWNDIHEHHMWDVITGDLVGGGEECSVCHDAGHIISSEQAAPLTVRDEWITIAKRRIILLPTDNLPKTMALHNNIIAMKSESGILTVIGISKRESYMI